MKLSFRIIFFLIISAIHVLPAQHYSYTADLINIKKDKVKVTCLVPKQVVDKIDFIFPNLIPGSYALKEYGRYIDDFTAFDETGKELKVRKADKYNFSIENASRLVKVEYYVDDSWEEKNGKRFIFQPGGTNIEEGKNFVINHYGFFGYIDGMKNIPFEITFLKPANLKGYSYLEIKSTDATTDVTGAPTYDLLVDNPVLYCTKNDASFNVGNSKIDLCVYSEKGKVQASVLVDVVKPVAHALEKFFGSLPVDHYLFMFYLADPANVPKRKGKGLGSGFGALEHNHCSFYFMPEKSGVSANKEMLQDVCSHEFLHILTPLNLHSREIEDFNFRLPIMSKHLWMYEGVTEYFSNLVLLQDSILNIKDFMKEMRNKMNRSQEFDNFSMTEMSKDVVESANQKRYLSVYSRGALLAMMLDILIIDHSEGRNSLREVLMKLSEKYGESKPFNDDDLISEIISLTDPDIKDFFDRYITGEMTPDYSTYFKLIGYDYESNFEKSTYFFGNFGLKYDDDKNEFSFSGIKTNFLGVKEGDVLHAINGEEIDMDNLNKLFDEYFLENDEGKEVRIEIIRDGNKMTLSARPVKATMRAAHFIMPDAHPSQKARNNFRKFSGMELTN